MSARNECRPGLALRAPLVSLRRGLSRAQEHQAADRTSATDEEQVRLFAAAQSREEMDLRVRRGGASLLRRLSRVRDQKDLQSFGNSIKAFCSSFDRV